MDAETLTTICTVAFAGVLLVVAMAARFMCRDTDQALERFALERADLPQASGATNSRKVGTSLHS